MKLHFHGKSPIYKFAYDEHMEFITFSNYNNDSPAKYMLMLKGRSINTKTDGT